MTACLILLASVSVPSALWLVGHVLTGAYRR